MRKKRGKSGLLSWILSLALILAMMPSSVFAVTGSTVAADGEYTGTADVAYNDTVYEEEENGEWEEYSVTVTLTVSGGVISDIAVEGGEDYDSDSSGTYFNWAVSGTSNKRNGIKTALIGQAATEETIENWDGNLNTEEIDGVSGATCTYTAVKEAALEAIREAEEASSEESSELDYSELESAIESASALNEAEYTSGSWAALAEALEDAQEIIDAQSAESQEEIDAAANALTKAIEALEEAADEDTTSVEIAGVTYVYALEEVSGYTQIGDSSVYYLAEESLEGVVYYGTATLTYAEYYSGDVTEGDEYVYDTVTTATTSHGTTFTYVYAEIGNESSDIIGVTSVNVAVSAGLYVEALILEAADALEDDTVYAAAAEITLNEDCTEVPTQYKTLDADGTYGATVTNEDSIVTVTDATAVLSTGTTWGEYEIDITDGENLYLRTNRTGTYTDEDGNTQTYALGANVTGIILTTSDGYSVGLSHLANIWVQPWEITFNVSDTTSTKNVSYSGDLAKFQALLGTYISTVTYLTTDGKYVYDFSSMDGGGIYIKSVYEESVTGSLDEEDETVTIDEIDSSITNPVVTVYYTVGSGRTAVEYVLATDISEAGTYDLDTSEIEGLDGTYSVVLTSDNYSDIDVDIDILESQVEELELLSTAAQLLADSGILSGSNAATLAEHIEEASEYLEDETGKTMSEAYTMIDELEELVGMYAAMAEIEGETYLYLSTTESSVSGFTQIGDTEYWYAAVTDGLAEGTIYGTATLTYAEYYSGDVTETDEDGNEYVYDTVTTATTSHGTTFTYVYAEIGDESSDIIGVTGVNVAVDSSIYVAAAILSDAGEAIEEDSAYEKALAIALNEDYTTVPTRYKTLNSDGTYGTSVTAEESIITITDASAVLSTGTTWGEYEIDITDGENLYLRTNRTGTYTDEDGNTQTYALGANVTGIILTTSDGYSVGLSHLANIWVQPWEITFNVSDTTSTKNVSYSGDLAKFQALVGTYISTVTYLTTDGEYVYDFSSMDGGGIYIKPSYEGTATGSFSSDYGTFALDLTSIPEDLQDAVITVAYAVPKSSGHGTDDYELYSGEITGDGVLSLDLSVVEGLEGGDYVVTITSSNYADIDVEIVEVDTTSLEEAIETAGTLTESDYTAGSWSALEAALADAQAALEAARSQSAVDAAAEALNAAIEGLEEAQSDEDDDEDDDGDTGSGDDEDTGNGDDDEDTGNGDDDEDTGSGDDEDTGNTDDDEDTGSDDDSDTGSDDDSDTGSGDDTGSEDNTDDGDDTGSTVTAETLDYSSLNAAIATAGALSESDYTAESWATLSSALAAAQTALTEAASQEEIDAAAAALNAAILSLGTASSGTTDTSSDDTGSTDETDSTDEADETSSTTAADTGDSFLLTLYLSILLAALAGMGGLFAVQKKRR